MFKKEVRDANGNAFEIPDFASWFIAVSAVVVVVFGWFAMGQPGLPLKDGDYSCSTVQIFDPPGPGATVEGGKVVGTWDFDLTTGERTPLQWSNAKRTGRKELVLTSQIPMLRDRTSRYVCKWSSPAG